MKALKNICIPRWFTALLLFLLGALSGWAVNNAYRTNVAATEAEKHAGQHEFINPLLECEGSEDLITGELRTFKEKVEDLISKGIEDGKISYASVYFRDLNDGPWFGINEHERFSPGSLLKIPIMMGYLKEAESNPDILKTQIVFDRRLPPYIQYVRPSKSMEFGKSYAIEELIYRMIVYSDNDAAYLLILHDDGRVYNSVFSSLGLDVPPHVGPYKISIKKYTSFFRILFNASYLNKEMSNLALKILSNADFDKGIVAGVPSNIPVAQKFGELTTEEYKQFHDCGIVYYPNNPYLLCVMTRGDDYERIASVIRDVSRLTYEEVDRQVGGR